MGATGWLEDEIRIKATSVGGKDDGINLLSDLTSKLDSGGINTATSFSKSVETLVTGGKDPEEAKRQAEMSVSSEKAECFDSDCGNGVCSTSPDLLCECEDG